MSNSDEEWGDLTDSFEERIAEARSLTDGLRALDHIKEKEKTGKLTQYSVYGAGFKPTTSTVPKLESGIYDIDSDQNGVFCTPINAHSGLLLELPEMQSSEVIRTVEKFWASEKDYKDGNEFVIGGAAYRAGALIWGPPGSGKTSTLRIVNKKLVEKGGTVFYASIHPANVARFLSNFGEVEPNRKCIVILEDIDSLIKSYGESEYLSMLDSAKTIDNVLFIATTNYPEKLDPRIYNRPGRFSHVIKIGLPTDSAREAYLRAILKNHRDVDFIVSKTKNFTIDHLTALVNSVYREGKEMAPEIERLKNLFRIPKSDDSDAVIGLGKQD